MKLEERINAFSELSERLKGLKPEIFEEWSSRAFDLNKWFTPDNVKIALDGVVKYLEKETLSKWVSSYHLENTKPKKVGVVMAGNIPLAGFHDFLSILIAGHSIDIKKSSQDAVLLDNIIRELVDIAPEFKDKIRFPANLSETDAIIATGSDNTARYFEYYFAKKPHIIRKNRVSAAVLSGWEKDEDLQELGKDVFLYFGLGCRNVSKLFLPEGYDPTKILDAFESFSILAQHAKFGNNYDYNNAIYLLKKIPFLASNFFILKEDEGLVSPIAVLYYQYYSTTEHLKDLLQKEEEKLQVIVSANGWYERSIPFGKAQFPEVTDYADNVDTLKFLESL